MSRRATDWAWKTSAKGVRLLVLLALADYADKVTAQCHPSLPQVSEKTGLGTSTVRRELRNLEADGLVKTEVSSGGRHARSGYTLMLETQPERAGRAVSETRSQRAGKSIVTQPERAGSEQETQPERRETQPERAGNPTRAGGVVPKTGHTTSHKPTTGTASAARGELTLINPSPVRALNPGHVATAWIDRYRLAHPGVTETPRQKLQAAKEARALIEAGNDPTRVLAAAESAAEKGYSTVEREFALLARSPNGSQSNGHRAYSDPDPAEYFAPLLPPSQESRP